MSHAPRFHDKQSAFLVLFDIDGTLLSADRSGYFALEQAVIEILESPAGLSGIRLDGNTDSNALIQICQRDGKPLPQPPVIERFKRRYVEILKKEIVGKGHLKPGVHELLRQLSVRSDVCVGLVTGNIREGAEIKLHRFGLDRFFAFGAFGCEHPHRFELVGMAIKRAEAFSGVAFRSSCITVVGDTIHDVTSCHPWKVRSLGVATGSVSVDELQSAGAKWALSDLSETSRVVSLLTQEA